MTLSDLSIKRPIFVTCLVIVMLVVGAASMLTRPVDLFPDVTFPVVFVTTVYPGAGPAEIETLVTKPIEDEISTIAGIKRLTSRNLEGTSQVIAEFRLGMDIKYAEQQVRDRVSVAQVKFPQDAKTPLIRRVDLSDQPILRLALEANVGDAKLFDFADNVVKPRLTQVEDVGLIEVIGGRKREIHVELDREKLRSRELSVQGVSTQLGAAGENIPSGKVDEGKQETIFRSLGEFRSMKDIEESLVRLYGNEVATRISDVGTVKDTLEDEKSRGYVNGKRAIFIDVYRQSGSNTVSVVKNAKKMVDRIAKDLPTQLSPEAKLSVVLDGSKKIQDNLDDVKETILLGILLTVIVVYFFLGNGRSTIITGLALPNSLLGAFILMAIAGFTINIISLLALSLAIGLLIDDAIVVRENIFRYIEAGEDPVSAAKKGTKEVTLAVVATTLVVISVFGPVAFMQGVIGQFLKEFGLTICFAMAISLFDALTIAPMLSAYFAAASHEKPRSLWGQTMGRVLKLFDRFQTKLENFYERVLQRVVRQPIIVLGLAIVIFVVSSATIAFVPKTFNPPQETGEFNVDLDLPPGVNLAEMDKTAMEVDSLIRKRKEILYTVLQVGGRNGEANQASIYVRMVPSKERNISTTNMKVAIREDLKPYANANPKVRDFDPTGGAATRAFTMNLIGANQEEVEKYASALFTKLKADKRLADVDTSFRPGKPELQFRLIPKQADAYGISTRLLGGELRAQVEGMTPAKFRENGLEYDIRVRLKEDQRNLRDEFAKIFVPNVNQKLIRLGDVAKPFAVTGPATINRQDRGRYIQLSADLNPGAGLDAVMADAEKYLKQDLKLPPSIRYAYIGNAENFQEFGTSVLVALGFAVLFVFLVLASLYESFITPFAIMLALPLAVCGAFLAIFLAHESLTIFAVLGIIMLLGIASKNSILLVDYANQQMQLGVDRAEAMIRAGKVRLRPILMTSMALIAGTLPVALGLNEASKPRTSMGVGIIGGMISSTLLSLVVVPAAFLYIDRFRVWFEGLFRKLSGQQRAAVTTVPTSVPARNRDAERLEAPDFSTTNRVKQENL